MNTLATVLRSIAETGKLPPLPGIPSWEMPLDKLLEGIDGVATGSVSSPGKYSTLRFGLTGADATNADVKPNFTIKVEFPGGEATSSEFAFYNSWGVAVDLHMPYPEFVSALQGGQIQLKKIPLNE
jgi:hypothetical protein